MKPEKTRYDVIVVGAGNAASCAALSANEHGADVLMLEAAPQDQKGGNSSYTGGALRFAHNGVDDIKRICPDMVEEELKNVDFGTYTVEQYFDDMGRLTEYRSDPDLTELLITRSFDTTLWMRESIGVKMHPGLGRQAFKVDGKFKFWGGLAVHITGGGRQLVDTHHKKCAARGIPILYETTAQSLIRGAHAIEGVTVEHDGGLLELRAKAVVLACGGFEANAEMRTRYLGPNWDLAKVRGSRFNTGKGIQMALDAGAMSTGHWSGCHAVAWDVNAPPFGDIDVGDKFQKHNYPFGIVVNARGERFLNEGLDFHSYTYAKYGGELLKQPGYFAWQIFDQKATHLLRNEYRIPRITKVEADTIEALVDKLAKSDEVRVNGEVLAKTIREFNAAVRTDIPFNPNVLDGRCTEGLALNKTNWANRLDTPPYHAYCVTTGITFTFGGLKVTTEAEVESTAGKPIRGLYAAGELIGGLYYHAYASGTGLMAGAVFGRIAGRNAARVAKE